MPRSEVATVLPFVQPSYLVHRDVHCPADEIESVLRELRGFLRKTPYACGAPSPTGSLTMTVGDLRLRFSIGVYSHGAFSTNTPVNPTEAICRIHAGKLPCRYHPLMWEIMSALETRGYLLKQGPAGYPYNSEQEDFFNQNWIWTPTRGYEHIYLGITCPIR